MTADVADELRLDGSEGMMKIDTGKLTEPELVDLNNRIVRRLRFLRKMRAHTSMFEFSLGERSASSPMDGL